VIVFVASIGISYVWNSTGTTVFTDTDPTALALDSSNTLYVVETSKNRVQKYIIGTSNSSTVAGQADGVANSTSAFLNSPTDVAVDSNNDVYVLDKFNNRVQLWLSGASNGTTVAGIGKRYTLLSNYLNTCGLILKLFLDSTVQKISDCT
jgi:sugar lactone lactonase YvrE